MALKWNHRRAKARILAPTSGATELEYALKDLEEAHAEACRRGEKKHEKVVKRELKSLRADLVRQRKHDKKTFAGLFDRGSLYTEEASSNGLGNEEKCERFERNHSPLLVMWSGLSFV